MRGFDQQISSWPDTSAFVLDTECFRLECEVLQRGLHGISVFGSDYFTNFTDVLLFILFLHLIVVCIAYEQATAAGSNVCTKVSLMRFWEYNVHTKMLTLCAPREEEHCNCASCAKVSLMRGATTREDCEVSDYEGKITFKALKVYSIRIKQQKSQLNMEDTRISNDKSHSHPLTNHTIGKLSNAVDALRKTLLSEGATVKEQEERYLHAVFISKDGTADDLEFLFSSPSADAIVNLRSASRAKDTRDYGRNRKRLDELRQALGWEENKLYWIHSPHRGGHEGPSSFDHVSPGKPKWPHHPCLSRFCMLQLRTQYWN
eukprot:Gb_15194 [translate_table: standard]